MEPDIYFFNILLLALNIVVFGVVLYEFLKFHKANRIIRQRKAGFLEDAREEADEIIGKAIKKSEELSLQAVNLKEDISLRLDKSLQEAGEINVRKFDTELSKIGKKVADAVEKEAAEYKKKRLDSLNAEISAKVSEISLKVLNRAVSVNEQDQLVIAALEKAKAEGVL